MDIHGNRPLSLLSKLSDYGSAMDSPALFRRCLTSSYLSHCFPSLLIAKEATKSSPHLCCLCLSFFLYKYWRSLARKYVLAFPCFLFHLTFLIFFSFVVSSNSASMLVSGAEAVATASYHVRAY